jgi:hypothetical protein
MEEVPRPPRDLSDETHYPLERFRLVDSVLRGVVIGVFLGDDFQEIA